MLPDSPPVLTTKKNGGGLKRPVLLHFVAMTEEQAKQVTVVTYSTWLIWCARVQLGEEIRLFLAQTLWGFWLPIAPHCPLLLRLTPYH
jgi:hypothetical protein